MGQRTVRWRDRGRAGPGTPSIVARPEADPVAAAILLIAGAIGIWQLLLPWRTTSPGRHRIRRR